MDLFFGEMGAIFDCVCGDGWCTCVMLASCLASCVTLLWGRSFPPYSYLLRVRTYVLPSVLRCGESSRQIIVCPLFPPFFHPYLGFIPAIFINTPRSTYDLSSSPRRRRRPTTTTKINTNTNTMSAATVPYTPYYEHIFPCNDRAHGITSRYYNYNKIVQMSDQPMR